MKPPPARLIKHLGWVYQQIGHWESPVTDRVDGWSCRPARREPRQYHRAVLTTVPDTHARWLQALVPDALARYAQSTLRFVHCEFCDQMFNPRHAAGQIVTVTHRPVFGTESGEPEPCDLYWSPWPRQRDTSGRPHLVGITPDGHAWDLDGQAADCTMPGDRVHRCWVRHGDIPKITVDKRGYTCDAGDGSIHTGRWHGFLRGGRWVER